MKIEDLSPLAAMMTGKGAMGKAMRQGFGGVIPSMMANNAYADEEVEKAKQLAASGAAPQTMKKGGKTQSKSRGDGIAQRGRTKGRFV